MSNEILARDNLVTLVGDSMMKIRILIACCLVCGCVLLCGAERDSPAPFRSLEKQAATQWGNWEGSKGVLARLFREERKRLGVRFDEALMAYIGEDVTKHYWVSAFLTAPEYLQKDKSRPYLALAILEQGLAICSGKPDLQIQARALGMHVKAAVLSRTLGLRSLASSHKTAAEALASKKPVLAGAFPVLSRASLKVYESIETMKAR